MNEEKQIEEMAIILTDGGCTECNCDANGKFNCLALYEAERLYNAGYRKQSEGKWKDCFNGKYANATYMCSICGKGTLLKPDINELGNMEMVQALSPFCPNCGAKMKGGAE